MPSSILKTVKSTLSLRRPKNTIQFSDDTQLAKPKTRNIFDETETLIEDMLQEIDNMPNSYKVRHQNPFLNEFLRQVNIRNLRTRYHPHTVPISAFLN